MAMRKMRVFTTRGLERITGAKYQNAKRYVAALARAGYLRQEGFELQCRKWRLVRDSGPYPPTVRRDGSVFDVNTRTVYEDGVGVEVPMDTVEAAKFLGIGRHTVRRWARQGCLAHSTMEKGSKTHYVFWKGDLEGWLRQHGQGQRKS